MVEDFLSRGWVRFPSDPAIAAWASFTHAAGLQAMRDPALARWWVCEETWFVGVDALNNDPAGRLPDGPPLTGAPIEFIRQTLGALPDLHPAQLSVIRPGYPRPREGEGQGAFNYRLKRDAAHVDGVKLTGTDRRRAVEEPHAWVLGLPLNTTSPDAAPLVVWEGSHAIMRAAFAKCLAEHDPKDWPDIDVTETYTQARKTVFQTCKRVELHALPGEAYLLHRQALHGIAPWGDKAKAPPEGRMIAYFRPHIPDPRDWLSQA